MKLLHILFANDVSQLQFTTESDKVCKTRRSKGSRRNPGGNYFVKISKNATNNSILDQLANYLYVYTEFAVISQGCCKYLAGWSCLMRCDFLIIRKFLFVLGYWVF